MALTLCQQTKNTTWSLLVIMPLTDFSAIMTYDKERKWATLLRCIRRGNDIEILEEYECHLDPLPIKDQFTLQQAPNGNGKEYFINNDLSHFIMHSVDIHDKAIPPEEQTDLITEHVEVTKVFTHGTHGKIRFDTTLLPSYYTVGCWCQQKNVTK